MSIISCDMQLYQPLEMYISRSFDAGIVVYTFGLEWNFQEDQLRNFYAYLNTGHTFQWPIALPRLALLHHALHDQSDTHESRLWDSKITLACLHEPSLAFLSQSPYMSNHHFTLIYTSQMLPIVPKTVANTQSCISSTKALLTPSHKLDIIP